MSGGPTDDVVSLSIAQEATGCWSPSPDLARATGVPLERMTDAARELALAPDIATKVVATLVALRALRERHADREIEWRLIARKAERWLATQQVPTPAGVSSLDEWIARVTPGTVLTR